MIFLNISANVPYDMLPEIARVISFIDGLKPYLCRYVKQSNPQTLHQAIVNAREAAETYNSTNSSYPNFNQKISYPVSRTKSTTTTPTTLLYRTNSNTGNYRRTMSNASSVRSSMQLDNTIVDEEDVLNEREGERSSYDNSAADLSQLSEENKVLYREGKYFTCKEQGHISRQCPKRKKDSKQRFASHLKY